MTDFTTTTSSPGTGNLTPGSNEKVQDDPICVVGIGMIESLIASLFCDNAIMRIDVFQDVVFRVGSDLQRICGTFC